MTHIEFLTKAQKMRLPEFIDKWTRIGLSTEPADRHRAELAIRRMYEIAGMQSPHVVWCDSPLSMGLTRAFVQIILKNKFPRDEQLYRILASSPITDWDFVLTGIEDNDRHSVDHNVKTSDWAPNSVRDSVLTSIRASIWDNDLVIIGDKVRDAVRDNVLDTVRRSVGDVETLVRNSLTMRVRNSPAEAIWEHSVGRDGETDGAATVWGREHGRVWFQGGFEVSFWDNARANVANSIWNSVWNGVWTGVRATIESRTHYSVRTSVENSVYGQHDANWLWLYAYFAEVCGLTQQTELLGGLWELSRTAGWALPHEKICWISERPCLVRQGENRGLHSVTGPAIAYPDGFRIYAVHGVCVPRHVIVTPDEITVAMIESERNQEVRRIMISRYKLGEEINGAAAYLRDCGAEIVEHDERWGTLRRKARPNDSDLLIVEVINNTPEPSGEYKHYWLRVHPDCRPMPTGSRTDLGEPQELTALNAVASTWGLTGPELARRIEATEAAGYRARS